jgi:hypothetical protein
LGSKLKLKVQKSKLKSPTQGWALSAYIEKTIYGLKTSHRRS